MKLHTRKDYRTRRHRRVRKKISGTADRPRMAIMVSNKHMYVQFIDDEERATLAAASTLNGISGHNLETARQVGRRAGEVARANGISNVVVDRGGFKYHGRVKAMVDAAVEAGIMLGCDTGNGPAGGTTGGNQDTTGDDDASIPAGVAAEKQDEEDQ